MRMSARGSRGGTVGGDPDRHWQLAGVDHQRPHVDGKDLVSVMTRKLDSPHAAAPRVPTVPSTSTAAAAMSNTRIAVRPPGDSGGGVVAGGAAVEERWWSR